jgi:hypothetical protein
VSLSVPVVSHSTLPRKWLHEEDLEGVEMQKSVLNDGVAVVTGASKGIGLAVAGAGGVVKAGAKTVGN